MDSRQQRTRLVVNGAEHLVDRQETTPLLSVLRDDLGLFGVRPGCGVGECGSCTVIVDGNLLRSCITPLDAVADQGITTPEGLGTPDAPGPIQRAFLQEQAAQCGYCINGMMMSVAALLEKDDSSDEAIVSALDEHICRCGTHLRILRAARRAVAERAAGATGDRSSVASSASRQPVSLADDVAAVAATEPHDVSGQPRMNVPVGERVESRLCLLPDGRVEVQVGKVEIGQGIRTAFAQIVSAELGLPVDRIVVRHASTALAPDEGYTAGSMSLERGGTALAAAAVAFRRLLLERGGRELGVSAGEVRFEGGRVVTAGGAWLELEALAERGGITGPIEAGDVPTWDGRPLGSAIPREDLLPKLTGAPAYVHDMALPGMAHARALLPPTYDARLAECDPDGASQVPGVLDVFRDGQFVLVIADRMHTATRAVERLAGTCRWDDPGLATSSHDVSWLRTPPIQTHVARQDPLPTLQAASGSRVLSIYSKPYEAHASVAPSCAVAVDDGTLLKVWTHSQGIYPLRRELSALLALDESRVVVEHRDGPGCYGHNAADDAAAFAALAARRTPGRPVRFQFSVHDEFTWEPYGPAMEAELEASLDASGALTSWRHLTRSDVHHARPNGEGNRLVPAWLRADPLPRPRPDSGDLGARNAVPLYDVPCLDARAEYISGPLRASALRSLGAYLNVFAIESFMDELAEVAGVDPLAFRLRHLSDPRARTVLELAAERAGWQPRVGPSGNGRGLAFSRYKNAMAYVALVVDVAVDPVTAEIRVGRVVLACDAGGIVNPDGLRNQLEGGVLQGMSRALHEQVHFDAGGIRSRDWTSYPVLEFSEIPEIDVFLVDRGPSPPLGAGEASTPPTPAALANAVDDAVGIRLRHPPFTPKRLRERLMDMGEHEMARVRL